MSNRDLLGMCIRNLFKRKLRTFLTVLGVMVGTASIVVMISLGLALNAKFEQELQNMGDVTVIQVYDYSAFDGRAVMVGSNEAPAAPANRPKLDDAMMETFERLPGVLVATPVLQTTLYFKSGNYTMYAWNCVGIKPEAMSQMGYTVQQGRLLQPGDTYEVVVGRFAEKNFEERNANRYVDRFYDAWRNNDESLTDTYVNIFEDKIGMSYDSRYIWGNENTDQEYDYEDENAPKPIVPYNITVVGMLEYQNDYSRDAGIYFDIDVLKKLKSDAEKASKDQQQEWGYYSAIKGNQDAGYENAMVKCTDISVTKQVFEAIQEMGFSANYPAQWLDYMQDQAKNNQMLLAAVGAVSLFVAAIGIANTMIMSIYERTREIGVMKVIGAAIRDIKWLFLLESAMIGFFGGVLGVGLSYLASYLLNNARISFFAGSFDYIGDPEAVISLITPWLCGLALLFACTVGLVSGYFPARRAMRLSALSAIRTE